MRISHLTLVLFLGAVTACGGGSNSGGGSDGSFASNMSGTWTGMLDEVGYQMEINHEQGAGTGTGTVSYSSGGGGSISLTNNGDDVTIVQPEVTTGCDGTFTLTLTSPDTAEGFFDLGPCGYSTATTITRI